MRAKETSMRLPLRIALLALAAAGCANQGAQIESPPSTNTPRKDIVIQFDDASVEPSVARVKRGGSVAWTSVASTYRGVISFPDNIRSHLTCTELRPDFFEAGNGRLQSIPIAQGQEDVVLPCPLEPGSYEYRIDLYTGAQGMVAPGIGMGDPMRSIECKLIVE
jgi:hypothetical protein